MQAQFSQMRPIAIAPSMAPRMPIYPPGAPGLGQQFLYGQAPPALIPPQVITLIIFYIFNSSSSLFFFKKKKKSSYLPIKKKKINHHI